MACENDHSPRTRAATSSPEALPPERLGRSGKRLKELRRRVRHRRSGEVVVDGRRLIEELVSGGARLQELYLGESLGGSVDDLLEAADQAWMVADDVLSAVAPTRHPQGLLAVIDEPDLGCWDARQGTALYLDQIKDPGNMGAIIRSAAALDAAAVLLGPGCADPFHPGCVRGSAAAVLRIPIERVVQLETAADRVHCHGGAVWAADIDGEPVASWSPGSPCLIVLGTEGAGLGERTRAQVDARVTIPLSRGIDSLNVAVAAAILLHSARQAESGVMPL